MRNKRDSRQITVLRSLFKTLHPLLESGLAPARRLLTGTQAQSPEQPPQPNAATPNRAKRTNTPAAQQSAEPSRATKTPTPSPLERTLADEHLVLELENINRQISQHGHTAHTQNFRRASPHRGQRHYSRDKLLSLLEEAKVRIQVLETELELARGIDETIPMLTEEWSDEAQLTGKQERQD